MRLGVDSSFIFWSSAKKVCNLLINPQASMRITSIAEKYFHARKEKTSDPQIIAIFIDCETIPVWFRRANKINNNLFMFFFFSRRFFSVLLALWNKKYRHIHDISSFIFIFNCNIGPQFSAFFFSTLCLALVLFLLFGFYRYFLMIFDKNFWCCLKKKISQKENDTKQIIWS